MKYLFLSILIFSLSSCSQNKRLILGKEYAQEELKIALSNKPQHNVVNSYSLIIKDTNSAIKIAETVLFEIYGKQNIEKQKPYETYLIDKYWIISGTLPEDYKGGTFLIIIDSRNAKILKITHGK